MDSNEKAKKLKISKIISIIGAIIIAVGIAILIVGIIKYKEAKAAYDEWHNAWWNDGTATINDAPSTFPWLAILGGFVTFFGLSVLFVGLRPYLFKMAAKMHKETLDIAGKDLSEAGIKTFEVAEPVVKKGAEVITPVIGNLAETVSEAVSTGISKGKAKLICPHCKKQISEDCVFCPKCGERIS